MRRLLLAVLASAGCTAAATGNVDPVHTANVRGTVAPKQTMDLTRDVVYKEMTFNAGREKVWQALLEAHEALKIPLANGSATQGSATFRDSNRIRTVAGKAASRYIDCGVGPAGPRADSYRLDVRVTHHFENANPGVTVLKSAVEGWARNPGLSSDPVACRSTGVLEREIAGMVMTRLQ
jgi:hypothetical protein